VKEINSALFSLFGKAADHYFLFSTDILKELSKQNARLYFVEKTDYEHFLSSILDKREKTISIEHDIATMNQIVGHETLTRVYIAFVSFFCRQNEWIRGMIYSLLSHNYLSLAANIRAFMESACDGYYSLVNIPLHIAENSKKLMRSISAEMSDMVLDVVDIEQRLKHFQFAEKISSSDKKIDFDGFFINNAFVSPKTMKEYMSHPHFEGLQLYEKYRHLCNISHPARPSLDQFIEYKKSSEGTSLTYCFVNPNLKESRIENLCENNATALGDLLQRVMNLILTGFVTLNYFGNDFYSDFPSHWQYQTMPLYKRIDSMFNKNGIEYPTRKDIIEEVVSK
jgi:hypothetical protein